MGEMAEMVEMGWDGEDEYYYTSSTPLKTCRCCGEDGLSWGWYKNRWVLFDGSQVHHCPKNPIDYNDKD